MERNSRGLKWFVRAVKWLFAPAYDASESHLGARWLFLRALGIIYFSAFYSLVRQVTGLIGPNGILPAPLYLQAVALYERGWHKFYFAPSVFWGGTSDRALLIVCWIGMIAATLLIVNFWPRLMLGVCFICFLSFIATLQDFSSYQSDGMLLEAGFICLFFAPGGIFPRWRSMAPPSCASLFLLQWEWFRIYFESGIGKLLGGDPEWRHFTAMYDYYQNGPLPTWIGWYVQQAPHWFARATALATLIMEIGVALMLFLPRRWRIVCFFIVTPWEIGVILTANYAFLNYLVLFLGFLLLDDKFLTHIAPKSWFPKFRAAVARLAFVSRKLREEKSGQVSSEPLLTLRGQSSSKAQTSVREQSSVGAGLARTDEGSALPSRVADSRQAQSVSQNNPPTSPLSKLSNLRRIASLVGLALAAIFLTWIFYATAVQLIWMPFPNAPLPQSPVEALAPFRIANQYGLFERMTRGRYEIEFQGSNDGGKTWTAYPFLFKPQALNVPPGIYAPYQPRFDWNLWFASLGDWQQYRFVLYTEEALLDASPEVLNLFAGDPFPQAPPQEIRAVLWQYWFTDFAERRATGDWWRRKFIGIYAPVLLRKSKGRYAVVEVPPPLPPHD